MRSSCLNCARKHLAKALININESLLGYPTHRWLAIGHMSEAEDELLARYREKASLIREHRKAYEEDPNYIIPILEIIDDLTTLFDRQMQEDHRKSLLRDVLEKGAFRTEESDR